MEHLLGRNWSPRRSALAAIAGAVLGVALTPFMASVWAFDDEKPWSEASRLERAVGPKLESWGLLDFGGDGLPYETYGKPFVLVYALMIPAMLGARGGADAMRRAGRFERWSWRAAFVALLAGGAGDFVAYWGISLPGVVGEGVSVAGFVVEFFAMPVVLLASTAYGVAAFRARAMARWACTLLVIAPASAIATTLLVSDYVPNAVIVPLSVTWAVITAGSWLLGDGAAERRDRDPAPLGVTMSP